MLKPKVDVVIRFKDEEFWLSKLKSKFSKLNGVEIYLYGVDNNSTDRSRLVFESFDNPNLKGKYYQNLEHYKPGRSLNLGALSGQSDYIMFLSAHCMPKDDDYVLKMCNSLMNEDQKCAGVFGRQLPLPCSGPQNTVDLILTYPNEDRILRRTPLFNNASAVIRREVYQQYNFNEKVGNLEDFIWAKKLQEKGYYFKYTSAAEVYHYHGIHQHELHKGNKRVSNSVKVLLQNGWLKIDHPDFCDYKKMKSLHMYRHGKEVKQTQITFSHETNSNVFSAPDKVFDKDLFDYVVFSSVELSESSYVTALSEVAKQTSQISIVGNGKSEHNLQQYLSNEEILTLINTERNDLLFLANNLYSKIENLL